ncbi:MAG: hypothetical protein ACLFWL_15970, partial [Candidatus Brocadiia bacterium]
MKRRPDLLDENCPTGLEIFQITEEDIPSSHVYMEAQIFTPDSERFILHRSATPHGSDRDDPRHRYLLCDLSNDGELIPLTDEKGTTGPAISPDGQHLYYFIDQTKPGSGRIMLRRVALDGTGRETILELEDALTGSDLFLSRLYPLSTISSDGRRIIISGFLGDGQTEGAPWGFIRVDLDSAEVEVVPLGEDWFNLHPQYCRSRNPGENRDLLVQHNHDGLRDAAGEGVRATAGAGCDVHVIRDDGSDLRDMPWGRDGNEFCQGHQCWIGRTVRGITSTGTREPAMECGDSSPLCRFPLSLN